MARSAQRTSCRRWSSVGRRYALSWLSLSAFCATVFQCRAAASSVAAAPLNVTVIDIDTTSVILEWAVSSDASLCTFSHWSIEFRRVLASGVPAASWEPAEGECAAAAVRAETSCNATGLYSNSGHEIRIRENCVDPSRSSSYAVVDAWTAPGYFDTYIGDSKTASVTVKVMNDAAFCYPEGECCVDTFSMCYNGSWQVGKYVTLTRTDELWGWGQRMWIRCVPPAAEKFMLPTLPPQLPAEDVPWLTIFEPRFDAFLVRFDFGMKIHDCRCAEPELQLRKASEEFWNMSTGFTLECQRGPSAGSRQCVLEGVEADTVYYARVRVACSNEWRNSGWTYSEPLATRPLCRYSLPSGRDTEYQCMDMTFCNMSDDSCCNARGGRYRCPNIRPVFCWQENACAGGTDYCCDVSKRACDPDKVPRLDLGRRRCLDSDLPSKEPVIKEFSSLKPASLMLRWDKGAYLSGAYPPCILTIWDVWAALDDPANPGKPGTWFQVTDCVRNEPLVTECEAFAGIRPMMPYHMRVQERCTEPTWDSYISYTDFIVITRPIRATVPPTLAVSDVTDSSIESAWTPGLPENCTFVAWELWYQVQERAEIRNYRGSVEKMEPRGPWTLGCTTTSRTALSCRTTGLLSNRDYLIRVRETCTDPYANSFFKLKEEVIRTVAVPAYPPLNLRLNDTEAYSLRVQWDANDPRACVFAAWEVEVMRAPPMPPTWFAVSYDYNNALLRCTRRDIDFSQLQGISTGSGDEVCETRGLNCIQVIDADCSNIACNETAGVGRATLCEGRQDWRPDEFGLVPMETRVSDLGANDPAWEDLGDGCCADYGKHILYEEVAGDLEACKKLCRSYPNCGFVMHGWFNQTSEWCAIRSRFAEENCHDTPLKTGRYDCGGADAAGGVSTHRYRHDRFGCVIGDRDNPDCVATVALGSDTIYDVRVRETCMDPIYNSPWSYLRGVRTLPPVQADNVTNITISTQWPFLLQIRWDELSSGQCDFQGWSVEFSPKDPWGLNPPYWQELPECRMLQRDAKGCDIKAAWKRGGDATLLYDHLYIVRIREACTDPNAYSIGSVFEATTRPYIPADPPTTFYYRFPWWEMWPERPYPFAVYMRWKAGFHYDCAFKEWNFVAAEYNTTLENASFTPNGCGDLKERIYWDGSRCTATEMKSDTAFDIKVQEICTKPWLNSQVSQFMSLTAPKPATRATDVKLAGLSEHQLTATFSGATIADCADPETFIQVAQKGQSWWSTMPFVCTGALEAGECVVSQLEPDTMYFAHIQVKCPSRPNVSSNFTEFEPEPTLPGCKWSLPSEGSAWDLRCVDGSFCNITDADCCNGRGGRDQCPSMARWMCNEGSPAEGIDYHCAEDCSALGGRRACGPDDWPAKRPDFVVAESQFSASIMLVWRAGVYLSKLPSACNFSHWKVEVANVSEAGVQGAWRTVTECGALRNRSHGVCDVTPKSGLLSQSFYRLRVSEMCHQPALSSLPTETNVLTTLGWRAGRPENVTVEVVTNFSLKFSWDPGRTGDCIFRGWDVAISPGFPLDLATSFIDVPTCSSLPFRNTTECMVTGVWPMTPYILRVREVCVDHRTDGPFFQTSQYRWVTPGLWDVYVGSSVGQSTVSANTLLEPHSCYVVKQCCDDEHSICYGRTRRQMLTITRTDTYLGWGQRLWLRCRSYGYVAANGLPAQVRATAPFSLELRDPDRHDIKMLYSIGAKVGTCECARPQVQLTMDGSHNWTDFGGRCTDMLLRDCMAPGLLADTRYFGRIRIACDNEAMNSNFTRAFDKIETFPGCRWSLDSGYEDKFECEDGTLCDMSDEQCCGNHGGRQRCPKSAPVMCNDPLACAGGTDRCCVKAWNGCGPYGGRRTCLDTEVPAKPPQAIRLINPTPSSLLLTWEPGEYLVHFKKSMCRFEGIWGWIMDLAELNETTGGPSEWQPLDNCMTQDRLLTSCLVGGLKSMTTYFARVREFCKERRHDSYFNITLKPETTLPIPALSVENITIPELGLGYALVTWDAGLPMDCTFTSWELSWRHWQSSGQDMAWHVTGCNISSPGVRAPPLCNVTGLALDTAIEFRVIEKCTDPNADSLPTISAPIKWNRVDEWDIYFGPSHETRKMVDVIANPARCVALSSCCFFSFCHKGTGGRKTTVTRSEYPGPEPGWTVPLWLRCVDNRVPLPTPQKAATASWLQLTDSGNRESALAIFYAGSNIGDCRCAVLHLELKPMDGPGARGSTDWFEVFEPCLDFGYDRCVITGLTVNTKYDARMFTTCERPELNSDVKTAVEPYTTPPGCKWSITSGREHDYQCLDGSYCPIDVANGTCCSSRDGIARCPISQPTMCAEPNACADGTDYCCSVDCSQLGGRRVCEDQVPAETATNLDVALNAPASLSVNWEPGEYLAGNARCTFYHWRVQLSRVENGVAGPWVSQFICTMLNRKDLDGVTTCELTGLGGLVDYYVRVIEVCTNQALNSIPVFLHTPVTTLPRAALAPFDITCGDVSSDVSGETLPISWSLGTPFECTFAVWRVEVRLQPRSARLSPQNLYEKALNGGEWMEGCNMSSAPRTGSSCIAPGLLSGREYDVRIKEICTDARADSLYGIIASPFSTNAVPAIPPNPVTIPSPDIYNFEVQWVPNDPKACVFYAWEVTAVEVRASTTTTTTQLSASNESETDVVPPASTTTTTSTIFSCMVYSERDNTSCVVDVGLGSGRDYAVEVRELCTDSALSSPPTAVVMARTLMPTRAAAPSNLNVAWPSPFVFIVSWTSGDPGLCEFVSWHVEIAPSGGTWEEMTPCSLLPRTVTSCNLSSALLSSTSYDVRVTETCTDSNADSPSTSSSNSLMLRPQSASPSNLKVMDVGTRWLLLTWQAGVTSSDCPMPSWQVEYKEADASLIGASSLYESGWAGQRCYWTTCNITGLGENLAYWIKVIEACESPLSLRSVLSALVPFSTLPGKWTVFIGASHATKVTVNVGRLPYRCKVVKSCCSDEFSVCYDSVDRRLVTVTRTDVDGGWGQDISLECVMASMEPFTPRPSKQAATPEPFLVWDPTKDSARVRFPHKLGVSMEDCECAEPRFQVRRLGTSKWIDATLECPNAVDGDFMTVRECNVVGLLQETTYSARLGIACENESLSSGFADALYRVRTINPMMVINGSDSVSPIVSPSRRLATSFTQPYVEITDGAIEDAAVGVLSELTGLPSHSIVAAAHRPTKTSAQRLLTYHAIVAEVGGNRGISEVSASHTASAYVATTAPLLSSMLAARLEMSFGQKFEIETIAATSSALRLRAFAGCLEAPFVLNSHPDWDAARCAGFTWSDGPCNLTCAAGYWPDGAPRCSAAGVWVGPARCVPDWVASEWSECSNGCGYGIRTRRLVCPGSGCVSGLREPTLQEVCYGTSWCSWKVLTDWGQCSNQCGSGWRERQVECSSSRSSDDCAGYRPENITDCFDTSNCQWRTLPWNACSSSCGAGTQSRIVECPSGNAAHCPGVPPSATQSCRNTSGCEWRTSSWSACSSTCGAGEALRDVWCPSGVDAECSGERPAANMSCYVVEGCSWEIGSWSSCNSSCGGGFEVRALTCPSGRDEDCPSARPPATQKCYDTSACAWSTSPWSECDNQCGSGSRTRSVVCPSGFPNDCSGARPVAHEPCYSTEGCEWSVSAWSICSASCGTGMQIRTVACPSGHPDDCSTPSPAAARSCRNISSCFWHASSWSECSNSCGSGEQVRSVYCSSGHNADCVEEQPNSSRSCSDTSGCGWNTSQWSACSSTCGSGNQSRTRECVSAGGVSCAYPGPSTTQSCYATSTCSWAISNWSTCSSTCGAGIQFRSVECSSGNDADCADEKPITQQACYETFNCSWQVSQWTVCSETCGEGVRKRSVACPSGKIEDCPGQAPAYVQPCRENIGCKWVASGWSACSEGCGAGVQHRHVDCTGSNSSDCEASLRPSPERACYSTSGCAWQLSAWSACSVQCGAGIQNRSVKCPTGNSTDCTGQQPSATRQCHQRSGCAWSAGPWSVCTSVCGIGSRSRSLACSSGNHSDCDHLERPHEVMACGAGDGRCSWVVGEWSSCSSTLCGMAGVRVRHVSCPSTAGPSDCRAMRPHASEACTSRSQCGWQATDWSTCEDECGWGTQSRSVFCPDGSGASCAASTPSQAQSCYSKSGCGWSVGEWSACNSTCGRGTQTRSATCTGSCTGPGPNTSQSCMNAEGCSWITSEWSKCSTSCGSGLQRRMVNCSSGVEEDCAHLASERPEDWQPCRDVSACEWIVSKWDTCNARCGSGIRSRVVSCSSDDESNCLASQRPVSVEACMETIGCTWQFEEWSSCSSLCGPGSQSRRVFCPSNNETACAGERPPASRPCPGRASEDTSTCNWTVSAWSKCSRSCGPGVQRRNVTCVGSCQGPEPESSQSCSMSDCNWIADQWSPCSSSCGNGSQTREIRCSGGANEMCMSQQKPLESRSCRSVIECKWLSSEWSPCGKDCSPQTRNVWCSSGRNEDCRDEPLIAVRACTESAGGSPCKASANEQSPEVRVSLRLTLEGNIDEHRVALLHSTRKSFATLLQIEESQIEVSFHLVTDGSRRLSSGSSVVDIVAKILSVSNGGVALLQSNKGQNVLAQSLQSDLEKSGVSVVGVIELASPPEVLSLVSIQNISNENGTVDTSASSLVDEGSGGSMVAMFAVVTCVVAIVAIVLGVHCFSKMHKRASASVSSWPPGKMSLDDEAADVDDLGFSKSGNAHACDADDLRKSGAGDGDGDGTAPPSPSELSVVSWETPGSVHRASPRSDAAGRLRLDAAVKPVKSPAAISARELQAVSQTSPHSDASKIDIPAVTSQPPPPPLRGAAARCPGRRTPTSAVLRKARADSPPTSPCNVAALVKDEAVERRERDVAHHAEVEEKQSFAASGAVPPMPAGNHRKAGTRGIRAQAESPSDEQFQDSASPSQSSRDMRTPNASGRHRTIGANVAQSPLGSSNPSRRQVDRSANDDRCGSAPGVRAAAQHCDHPGTGIDSHRPPGPSPTRSTRLRSNGSTGGIYSEPLEAWGEATSPEVSPVSERISRPSPASKGARPQGCTTPSGPPARLCPDSARDQHASREESTTWAAGRHGDRSMQHALDPSARHGGSPVQQLRQQGRPATQQAQGSRTPMLAGQAQPSSGGRPQTVAERRRQQAQARSARSADRSGLGNPPIL